MDPHNPLTWHQVLGYIGGAFCAACAAFTAPQVPHALAKYYVPPTISAAPPLAVVSVASSPAPVFAENVNISVATYFDTHASPLSPLFLLESPSLGVPYTAEPEPSAHATTTAHEGTSDFDDQASASDLPMEALVTCLVTLIVCLVIIILALATCLCYAGYRRPRPGRVPKLQITVQPVSVTEYGKVNELLERDGTTCQVSFNHFDIIKAAAEQASTDMKTELDQLEQRTTICERNTEMNDQLRLSLALDLHDFERSVKLLEQRISKLCHDLGDAKRERKKLEKEIWLLKRRKRLVEPAPIVAVLPSDPVVDGLCDILNTHMLGSSVTHAQSPAPLNRVRATLPNSNMLNALTQPPEVKSLNEQDDVAAESPQSGGDEESNMTDKTSLEPSNASSSSSAVRASTVHSKSRNAQMSPSAESPRASDSRADSRADSRVVSTGQQPSHRPNSFPVAGAATAGNGLLLGDTTNADHLLQRNGQGEGIETVETSLEPSHNPHSPLLGSSASESATLSDQFQDGQSSSENNVQQVEDEDDDSELYQPSHEPSGEPHCPLIVQPTTQDATSFNLQSSGNSNSSQFEDEDEDAYFYQDGPRSSGGPHGSPDTMVPPSSDGFLNPLATGSGEAQQDGEDNESGIATKTGSGSSGAVLGTSDCNVLSESGSKVDTTASGHDRKGIGGLSSQSEPVKAGLDFLVIFQRVNAIEGDVNTQSSPSSVKTTLEHDNPSAIGDNHEKRKAPGSGSYLDTSAGASTSLPTSLPELLRHRLRQSRTLYWNNYRAVRSAVGRRSPLHEANGVDAPQTPSLAAPYPLQSSLATILANFGTGNATPHSPINPPIFALSPELLAMIKGFASQSGPPMAPAASGMISSIQETKSQLLPLALQALPGSSGRIGKPTAVEDPTMSHLDRTQAPSEPPQQAEPTQDQPDVPESTMETKSNDGNDEPHYVQGLGESQGDVTAQQGEPIQDQPEVPESTTEAVSEDGTDEPHDSEKSDQLQSGVSPNTSGPFHLGGADQDETEATKRMKETVSGKRDEHLSDVQVRSTLEDGIISRPSISTGFEEASHDQSGSPESTTGAATAEGVDQPPREDGSRTAQAAMDSTSLELPASPGMTEQEQPYLPTSTTETSAAPTMLLEFPSIDADAEGAIPWLPQFEMLVNEWLGDRLPTTTEEAELYEELFREEIPAHLGRV